MNYLFWPEISFCLEEVEKEKLRLKQQLNNDKLAEIRDNINRHVEQLRISFEKSLDKQFASLALFPLIAYIDEDIQRHLAGSKQATWHPLQKDFYGAYNAGEVFYETIDKNIDDPQLPSIVPQMFYFLLKKGFLGKYRDSKIHIARYLEILKEKIPVHLPLQDKALPAPDTSSQKRKFKKWHYYAASAIGSISLFTVLYITSSIG